MCQLKWFMPLFTTICCCQEVGQVNDQTALREDKEGAIQNVTGDHSDDRRSFLTILDNVLTFGGSARGEERARLPQPKSGGLPKGAGGGTKNGVVANTSPSRSGGSESTVKNILTSSGPTLKKAKNKRGSNLNCLIFIEVF
jgi:hypothetical protein